MLYQFRILKTSWGIAIDINIEMCCQLDEQLYNIFDIDKKIVLQIQKNIKLIEGELGWLIKGVSDFYNNSHSNLFQENKTIISINSLVFNECDFQEEGLYCAIQGALGKYYDVETPIVNIVFDKNKNRYNFDIPIS